MKYFAVTIWFVFCILIGFMARRLYLRYHAVSDAPQSSVIRSEVYTLHRYGDHRSEGEYEVLYDSSHFVVLGQGGSSHYSGRWSGPYFIARERDTIAWMGIDSVRVGVRCPVVHVYTR